mmetsp:Transcript_25543/g.65650  ORF Transcript_25543/g.65650 Transcript_25543/m.65650 type:complete len:244 (-) Transcript_25543:682-1413(-)
MACAPASVTLARSQSKLNDDKSREVDKLCPIASSVASSNLSSLCNDTELHIPSCRPCLLHPSCSVTALPSSRNGCFASFSTAADSAPTCPRANKLVAAITLRLLLAASNPPRSCSTTFSIMILSDWQDASASCSLVSRNCNNRWAGNLPWRSACISAGRSGSFAKSMGSGSSAKTCPVLPRAVAIAKRFCFWAMTTFSNPHHMRVVTMESASTTRTAPTANSKALKNGEESGPWSPNSSAMRL